MQAAATLPFFPNRVAIEIKAGPKPRAYGDIDGFGYRRGDVGTHTSRTIMLADLPDDVWTRLNIEFYKDAADAVFKALVE